MILRLWPGPRRELTELSYVWRADMIKKTSTSAVSIAACLGMLFVMPVGAQPSTGPVSQDSMSQHHRLIYQTMKDMTQQMSGMTEQMSRSELTAEQHKQMSDRMGLRRT